MIGELGLIAHPDSVGGGHAAAGDASDRLLALMGYAPCGLDELATRSGIAVDALSVELLRLELDGKVASLPGGLYQRLAAN